MKLLLTRRYALAASHRLHSPQLSEEGNKRLYGKCDSMYGHGHNYILEVSVAGSMNPATDMVAHPGELDEFVRRQVLDVFDHTCLNEDIPLFREHVPTAENLCIEFFRRLQALPGARLECVRAEETSLNSLEYSGGTQGGPQGDERP